MAAGLQVFDASGVCIFDTNSRIAKVVGSMTISNDGGIFVSLPQGNQIFFNIVSMSDDFNELKPTFSISGGNLNWSYKPRHMLSGQAITIKSVCTFIYGIF